MNVPITVALTIIGMTAGGTYLINTEFAKKVEVASALQEQTFLQYEDRIGEAQDELNLLLEKQEKTDYDRRRIRQLEKTIRKYDTRQKNLK